LAHLSFIFGLLVYSISVVALLMLFLLWKKNKDQGIFWTIILMGTFTLLLIAMLIYSYMEATGLLLRIPPFVYHGLDLFTDLLTLSFIFTIPRFSWTMGSSRPWKKGIQGLFLAFLALYGLIHTIFYISLSDLLKWSRNGIQIVMLISLAATLLTILFFTIKFPREAGPSPWYVRVATSMACTGLFFLPLFFVFDFFPLHTSWEWLNRLLRNFSAVPVYMLIWNVRLIHGVLTQNALLSITDRKGLSLEQWMDDKDLTNREKEVTYLLIEGLSYAEICDKLCLSRATIKSHTNRIYKKTGISNQIGMIKEAASLINFSPSRGSTT